MSSQANDMVLVAQILIERFISSTSYSGYQLALMILPAHAIVALAPLNFCLVALFRRVQGMQNLFAMLAAQGLTNAMPIPYEQAGYLILPAVLLYISTVSSAACFINNLMAVPTPLSQPERSTGKTIKAKKHAVTYDYISIVIDQYVALFATSKALAYLESAQQVNQVAALATAYLFIPSSCIPHYAKLDSNSWSYQFMHIIQCLSSRLAVICITKVTRQWISTQSGLIAVYLALLILFPANSKLSIKLLECRGVLSLLCAQQLLLVIPSALFFLAALTIPMISAGSLRDVCVFAISIQLISQLGKWVADCGQAEAVCTYTSVFVLLQIISESIASAIQPDTMMVISDHDESDYNERLRSSYDSTEGSSSSSSNMADHSHSNSSGIHSIVIAHELAELGLPS